MKPHESITLDDGQVLSGALKDLNHYEILSLANQLMRNNRKSEAQALMGYQYTKFIKPNTPPRAA